MFWSFQAPCCHPGLWRMWEQRDPFQGRRKPVMPSQLSCICSDFCSKGQVGAQLLVLCRGCWAEGSGLWVSCETLPFPCCCYRKCERVSRSVMSDSFGTPWMVALHLLCPRDSPGKNTGVGSLSLLQGIFPTQGSNQGLPHCRRILHH